MSVNLLTMHPYHPEAGCPTCDTFAAYSSKDCDDGFGPIPSFCIRWHDKDERLAFVAVKELFTARSLIRSLAMNPAVVHLTFQEAK